MVNVYKVALELGEGEAGGHLAGQLGQVRLAQARQLGAVHLRHAEVAEHLRRYCRYKYRLG